MFFPNRQRFCATLGSLFVAVALLLLPITSSQAQIDQDGILPGETLDQPKERTTQITATVQDIDPPSIPILISPTNNSKHTSGTISFVWTESTDNFAMSHYRLLLNGNQVYGDLPLVSTTTSTYELVYDAIESEYTLTPSVKLADGTYSWRIEAVDIHDNSSSSVTWTFMIDSEAPHFTITDIADQEVTITTLDADSVPNKPIITEINQPELQGTGEAGSSVVLTIRLPGNQTREVEFDVDADGNWSVTLPTLPRDHVLWLDFLITDGVGNISVLEDIMIIIVTPTVEIPIPPVLLPIIPPVLLPEPPETPEEPTPPVIEIPIIPPQEIIPEIEEVLPPAAIELAESLRATSVLLVSNFWLILLAGLGLLIALLLPILKTLFLYQLYAGRLGFGALWHVWRVVGWDSWLKPQSLVVTFPHHVTSVPFALVRLRGKTESGREIVLDQISDERGIICRFDPPSGEYRVTIIDERIEYPVINKRPLHLDWQRFYAGEPFKITSKQPEPWLIIPAGTHLPISEKDNWRRRVLRMQSVQLPIAGVLTVVALLHPSYLNLIVVAVYAVLGLCRAAARRKNRVIEVISQNRLKVGGCVLVEQDVRGVQDIAMTDGSGIAKIRRLRTEAELDTISWKYRQVEGDGKTRLAVDAEKPYIVALMSQVKSS